MLIKARDDLHQFVSDLLDCIAHQVRRDRNVGRKLIEVVDAADRVYNSGIQVLTNIFGPGYFHFELSPSPSERSTLVALADTPVGGSTLVAGFHRF